VSRGYRRQELAVEPGDLIPMVGEVHRPPGILQIVQPAGWQIEGEALT
jgi:hypothetical protein